MWPRLNLCFRSPQPQARCNGLAQAQSVNSKFCILMLTALFPVLVLVTDSAFLISQAGEAQEGASVALETEICGQSHVCSSAYRSRWMLGYVKAHACLPSPALCEKLHSTFRGLTSGSSS